MYSRTPADRCSDSLRRHAKQHGDLSNLGDLNQQSSIPTPQSIPDLGGWEASSGTVTITEFELPPLTNGFDALPIPSPDRNTTGSTLGDIHAWDMGDSISPWSKILDPDPSNAGEVPHMGYSALLQPEFSVGGMGDPVQTEREIYNIMEDSDDSNQMRHPEGQSFRPEVFLRKAGPSQGQTWPEAGRLNMFANLYFTRFNPTILFIHQASFQAASKNALLFLALCSIGSQFAGSDQDIQIGTEMFNWVKSVTLQSWLKGLYSDDEDPFPNIYAGILCVQRAIHSATPGDLFHADCLQGLITAEIRTIARRRPAVFGGTEIKRSLDGGEDLNEIWCRWAVAEQQARAYHVIRINDVELAALLHRGPLARHLPLDVPFTTSDDLFIAPTAESWATLYKRCHIQWDGSLGSMNSSISAYGNLQSINGQIIDARLVRSTEHAAIQDLSHLLKEWWQSYRQSKLAKGSDPLSLKILWHSSYLSLYADCNLLDQVLCVENADPQPEAHAVSRASSWAMSADARICMLHAVIIQRHVENIPRSAEPAIHVPHALFQAGLIWLSCWRLTADNPDPPTTGHQGIEVDLVWEAGFKDNAKCQAHLVIDQLERLGRLGLSRVFACRLRRAIGREWETTVS
ncbi:hypothetical protein N7534_003871 [Penicillium rubens]|nr:hypothetical protein N7534_003871 [Penicillium rubens]